MYATLQSMRKFTNSNNIYSFIVLKSFTREFQYTGFVLITFTIVNEEENCFRRDAKRNAIFCAQVLHATFCTNVMDCKTLRDSTTG